MSDPRWPPGGHFGGIGNDVGALKGEIFFQIILVFGAQVHTHMKLFKFENRHRQIQIWLPGGYFGGNFFFMLVKLSKFE